MTRLAILSLLTAAAAFAHCDSVDGPVVGAARRALSSGAVDAVLPWVPAAEEGRIRRAFAQTVAVRALGPDAQRLADTWFFETVVRVHRSGEGAPFDGLKPAGAPVPAGIREADAAVSSGDLSALQRALSSGIAGGLRERFQRVAAAKEYDPQDVAAGRRYVAAYVEFIHFAERAVEIAGASASEHAGH